MDDDAVWSRVLSPFLGGRWEERLLWESEALGRDLAPLPPVRKEQAEISALLRGIRALEGSKPVPMPPRAPGERGLHLCYRDSLALSREFAARAADTGTGPLWQAAADRQMAQCVRIARAMGK